MFYTSFDFDFDFDFKLVTLTGYEEKRFDEMYVMKSINLSENVRV